MSFQVNPLFLCKSPRAFEDWLRDTGNLEVLDKNALDQAPLNGLNWLSDLTKALKINPFRSLTVEDFSKKPVSWTGEFFHCGLGPMEMYSYSRSLMQAKLRMEENVKRKHRYEHSFECGCHTRCCFCARYKMPVDFLGLLSIPALWDTLRVYINSRGLSLNSFLCRSLQLLRT